MEILALVPSQHGSAVLETATGSRVITGTDKLLEFFEQSEPSFVLGIMGGPQQNAFVRASQLGHSVCRIPWFKLNRDAEVVRGASDEERATALLQAWEDRPQSFYVMSDFDERMFRLRELTRVRLTIQQTYRIPAQLQYQATFRDLEALLPEGKQFAAIRTVFADPRLIAGAKEDEAALERAIKQTVVGLPIWDWLHPADGSALPKVKGLGPALGGALISEIGDIRRFPGPSHLRSYARYRVDDETGGLPRRRKGAVSSWNRYLERAVWLWSTGQVARYDHVWRTLYLVRKAEEIKRHPVEMREEIVRQDGVTVTVPRYTLAHLDARAKRWVGRELLNYVYALWRGGESRGDAEQWYVRSGWPKRFERYQAALPEAQALLEEELPQRRKAVPA